MGTAKQRLQRQRHSNKKSRWHKENKLPIFVATKGVCSECSTETTIKGGCIHHNTYKCSKDSIYNYSGELLLDKGVVRWVCHRCHEKIHATTSIDGITAVLKYSSCINCDCVIINDKKDLCNVCLNTHLPPQRSKLGLTKGQLINGGYCWRGDADVCI